MKCLRVIRSLNQERVANLTDGKLSWKQTCGHAEHLLGIIYAPDEKAAEAGPVAEFKINEDLRRRLIIRPNDE